MFEEEVKVKGKQQRSTEPYLALKNNAGEVIGFINPTRDSNIEGICQGLLFRGINVEIIVPHSKEVDYTM